jgi:hypothetical protein
MERKRKAPEENGIQELKNTHARQELDNGLLAHSKTLLVLADIDKDNLKCSRAETGQGKKCLQPSLHNRQCVLGKEGAAYRHLTRDLVACLSNEVVRAHTKTYSSKEETFLKSFWWHRVQSMPHLAKP